MISLVRMETLVNTTKSRKPKVRMIEDDIAVRNTTSTEETVEVTIPTESELKE